MALNLDEFLPKCKLNASFRVFLNCSFSFQNTESLARKSSSTLGFWKKGHVFKVRKNEREVDLSSFFRQLIGFLQGWWPMPWPSASSLHQSLSRRKSVRVCLRKVHGWRCGNCFASWQHLVSVCLEDLKEGQSFNGAFREINAFDICCNTPEQQRGSFVLLLPSLDQSARAGILVFEAWSN